MNDCGVKGIRAPPRFRGFISRENGHVTGLGQQPVFDLLRENCERNTQKQTDNGSLCYIEEWKGFIGWSG